ncbi:MULTISPECIES: fimbrial protein [unclassified Pseudomonas]|uniref:fimbrial protein n=1 Tax=unclassified Pseudomonas TaxID=196821 RepID=UPI0021C87837|nr:MULTISPECIES: fimbrial protein [unclassified Pseudomonas]MCU1733029.1 fimbrial protein [Pseudomonas sp. 20P_3.2_Bac4]MCU1744130.1 fimbrial protein [Pseudomonas sp. 20P_3.2_Bac5]
MKYSIFALPLTLMLASECASAIEPLEGHFSLTGTVPTESFSVVGPGNWMDQTQTLTWGGAGTSFGIFRQKILMKSTVGAISAYLVEPAHISNGDNVLSLMVQVNNVTLSEVPREVVRPEVAAPGVLVNFQTWVPPSSNPQYLPGDYAGALNMMFETAPPL